MRRTKYSAKTGAKPVPNRCQQSNKLQRNLKNMLNTNPRSLHGPITIALRVMQLALGKYTAKLHSKCYRQFTQQASGILSPLWTDTSNQNVSNYLLTSPGSLLLSTICTLLSALQPSVLQIRMEVDREQPATNGCRYLPITTVTYYLPLPIIIEEQPYTFHLLQDT